MKKVKTTKRRKHHPQPASYYYLDTDNCWFCKNRNGCGNCKFLKKQVSAEKEKRKRQENAKLKDYCKSFN